MLAIVIPYYKLSHFNETLKSLSIQTNKRFKVYIGNDASPEDPLHLLEKYKTQLHIVYHHFEENLGGVSLPKQWERCINLTNNEEWIMILGDDDYLEENVVESWYENYNKFVSKTNLIRFATKIVNEKDDTISDSYKHPIWESATDAYFRKFNYLTRSSLSEYIFKKQSFVKYGFYNYPLAWNSDDHAWLDFSDNKPIYTINETLVYFRLSNLNISGKDDNLLVKSVSQTIFYKNLINRKLKFYKKTDKIKILRRYENHILKTRKLTYREWIYLLYLYSRQLHFIEFKKIIKRFLNTKLGRYEY
ncbi:glycosyltransferase family 2 protein [Lacinutrix sp. Bg11-31]|uniref:glycosyltransferase family 2 protein n=1 Tax=Lacinutrix sp. Bg11-31 TaxID=2057808 RepID=UPI000C3163CE|nr:glycosyltransferase family 2 protein [Lacinutrix sp. Bg11-31]AUC82083.1 glycosyltransferase family 2 protein [Lacinutrix sp. Bg11-31]